MTLFERPGAGSSRTALGDHVPRPAGPVPQLAAVRFADLLLLRPPADARAAVRRMLARGVPPRSIYLEVLSPALREVGSRWQQGVATVGQEHLASAVVVSIMGTLSSMLVQRPPVGHRVLLACTDDERHEIGVRMVGDFLEGDGWEVLYLGASTPAVDLAQIIDRVRPDVVGLSTTRAANLPDARAAVAALRARQTVPFVLLGGAAYAGDAALAHDVGADAFALDAGAASALLRGRFVRKLSLTWEGGTSADDASAHPGDGGALQ